MVGVTGIEPVTPTMSTQWGNHGSPYLCGFSWLFKCTRLQNVKRTKTVLHPTRTQYCPVGEGDRNVHALR